MGREKEVVPICAMKGGQNLHQYVDVLVPTQAKFSLLQGEGPIHLVGSHCVDFFGYRETEEDDAEDESAEEDAEMEGVEEKSTAEDKKKTPTKESGDEKKRKVSADVPKSAEKKKKESPAK